MVRFFASLLFVLLFGLAGCSSPNSGFLIVGEVRGGSGLDGNMAPGDDDDDAASDDDDAVGDDDDAAGDDDDDDAVGDDDDTVEDSLLAGRWEGFMAIVSADQSAVFCEGSAELEVETDGGLLGSSSCELQAGGGDFVTASFDYTGAFDGEGDWREGTVSISIGSTVQQYATNAGLVEDQGEEILALSWPMTLSSGGTEVEVFGVVNAYR